MSLRAAKRNARRSINYNLERPVGGSVRSLADMLERGAALIAAENAHRADLGRPDLDDDRILMIEGPENHNDIDFGG